MTAFLTSFMLKALGRVALALAARWTLSLIALACVSLALQGCGQAQPVPAEGYVLLDGAPLADIGIKFVPADAPKWRGDPFYHMPWAITDAQGRFQMAHGVAVGGATSSSTHKVPGVKPGRYNVILSRYPAVARALTPDAVGFSTHRFAHTAEGSAPLSKLEWEWLKNPSGAVLKMADSVSELQDLAEAQKELAPAIVLAPRFFRPETTPLTVTIPASGRRDIRIDIHPDSAP